MLVVFVYLNTAVFPSKRLLRKIYPHDEQPVEGPPRALLPARLGKLVLQSTANGGEPEYEFEESSVLLDGRRFSENGDNGRTKKDELYAWLGDLTKRKNVQVDVTCFFDVGVGRGLVSGMRERQSECGDAFASELDPAVRSQLHFYGRMLPPQLGYILDQHSLDTDEAYVVTLTRADFAG